MIELNSPWQAKPLYAHLGLSDDVRTEDIRAAFMRIAKAEHPDLNGGRVSEEFERASHAYVILSDPAKRKLYDETGVDPDENNLAKHALMLITATAFRLISDGLGEADLVRHIRQSVTREIEQADLELRKIDEAITKGEMSAKSIEERWKGAQAAKAAILEMIAAQVEKEAGLKPPHERKKAVAETALSMLSDAAYTKSDATDLSKIDMSRFFPEQLSRRRY